MVFQSAYSISKRGISSMSSFSIYTTFVTELSMSRLFHKSLDHRCSCLLARYLSLQFQNQLISHASRLSDQSRPVTEKYPERSPTSHGNAMHAMFETVHRQHLPLAQPCRVYAQCAQCRPCFPDAMKECHQGLFRQSFESFISSTSHVSILSLLSPTMS